MSACVATRVIERLTEVHTPVQLVVVMHLKLVANCGGNSNQQ